MESVVDETGLNENAAPLTHIPRPPMYRRVLSSQYVKNNMFVLAAGLTVSLCNYLQNPLMVRLLGLPKYQSVVSLVSLSTVFLIPTQILANVVTRTVATLSAEGKLAELNDLLRRLTAILALVGAAFAAVFIVESENIANFLHIGSVQPVIIIALSFIIAFASPVNGGALGGLLLFSWGAPLSVLPYVLRLVMMYILVRAGLDINGALLAIVFSSLVGYLASFIPLRSLLTGPRLPSGSLRPLASYSVTAIIAAVGNALLFQVDIVLAGHYLPKEQAGLYAVVATLGKMVLFISSSLTTVLFPQAAALHQRGENTARYVVQTMAAMVVLSAAIETVFIVIPGVAVRVLYSASALGAADQLKWYGLAMLLFAPTQALMTYFLAINDRIFAAIVLVCCAIQATLIVARHQSVADIVQAVIVSIATLFVTLLVLFAARARHYRLQRRAAA